MDYTEGSETMAKRRSVAPLYSMCVQPAFILGTNNEDGTANFAPITWVSVTQEGDDGYMLVVSMFGTKRTKQNVLRTGMFSANLVSVDMLPLMDYFGSRHAADGKKDRFDYAVSRGEVLDAVKQIRQSGCPVVGCIINRVSVRTRSERSYYKNHY